MQDGLVGGAARPRGPGVRIVVALTVALVLALLLRTFVVQTFSIPSDSMDPTLRPGERVLVWRSLGDPAADLRRGDVVVFDGSGTFAPSPPEPTGLAALGAAIGQGLGFRPGEADFVKRVVGLPGDRISCCDAQGRLLVNGEPVDEPYLFAPGSPASATAFDIEVPAGRIWLMGDNREQSTDSRSHLGSPGGGTVAVDDVIGRVVLVTWPLSQSGPVQRDAPLAGIRRAP
ncbi:signal peptidase I [Kineococcus gynurae]|uniref:signal peptidase I n=1 Tax=Kineococcus gynurae TaxID=452979 RepID=UPI003D7CD928